MDGCMGGCNACFKDCCGWMDGLGVMPLLRIVVDGWMGGCNACFKDCCGWMDGLGVMPLLRIVVDKVSVVLFCA